MIRRRQKQRSRVVILSLLCIVFGVLLLSFAGIFISSNIIAAEAKIPIENMECERCNEMVAKLIAEEEEAIKKAEEEKRAKAVGIIYLTFDDGPGDHTSHLLDILKNHNVKATFFVTGRGADDILKREFDEGHTIALHTWSHKYSYLYANISNFFSDLAQVSDRVKNITGQEAKIIRFPGGSSNTVSARYDGKTKIMSRLVDEVTARGYIYFDWNVDSDDAGRAKDVNTVYTNVISHLKPGENVVLQHDIYEYSVEAVEKIIEYGEANGYIFSSINNDTTPVHHGVNN